MRVVLLFGALVVACTAQWFGGGSQWTCGFYSRRDCDNERARYECGSDGKTYRNRCDFTQARCAGLDIDVLYYDKCDNRTNPGGPVITGEAAVLDYFCVELAHESCPADQDFVCASNNKTYDNMCEYEKAKCTHRQITVTSFGSCST